jgi:hypothetical protein
MAQPAKAKSGAAGVTIPITITNNVPSNQDVACNQGDIIQFTAKDQSYVVAFDNFPLGISLDVNEPELFPVTKQNFTAHYGITANTGAVSKRILDAPYRIQGGTGNEGGGKK